MLDLFPETVRAIDMTQDGATRQTPNGRATERNWRGWYQYREAGQREWVFYVTSFSGPEEGDAIAHVYRWTGPNEVNSVPVRIDGKNRLHIDGKRYGRTHWNH